MKSNFNDFRFAGFNYMNWSNKYLIVKERVASDKKRIIVKVSENQLVKTQYGYALILDASRVVFLKDWQVNINFYGVEVILDEKYFNVKEWGEWFDYGKNDENCSFAEWLKTAEEQDALVDEDGDKLNKVMWAKM